MSSLRDCRIVQHPGEMLSAHTSLGIGGPAQFWCRPGNLRALREVILAAMSEKVPVRIIGAGTNLLVSDAGVRGLVVQLRGRNFARVSLDGPRMTVGAGCTIARAISCAARSGLSGLEQFSGIPGTVGGALIMNAGVRPVRPDGAKKDYAIGDLVEFVTVMDYNGKTKNLSASEARFGYRCSALDRYIVLGCCLHLHPANPGYVREQSAAVIRARRAAQGNAWRSAGCVFKNPAGESAGRLIDKCGLKGARSGGAVVSSYHANFILNDADATAADVLALMRRIKRVVKKKFSVSLEPEIKIWK